MTNTTLAQAILGPLADIAAEEELKQCIVVTDDGSVEALRWSGGITFLMNTVHVHSVVSLDAAVAAVCRSADDDSMEPTAQELFDPWMTHQKRKILLFTSRPLVELQAVLAALLHADVASTLIVASTIPERAHGPTFSFDTFRQSLLRGTSWKDSHLRVRYVPLLYAALLEQSDPRRDNAHPGLFVLTHPLCAPVFPLMRCHLNKTRRHHHDDGDASSWTHVQDISPQDIPESSRKAFECLAHVLGSIMIQWQFDTRDHITEVAPLYATPSPSPSTPSHAASPSGFLSSVQAWTGGVGVCHPHPGASNRVFQSLAVAPPLLALRHLDKELREVAMDLLKQKRTPNKKADNQRGRDVILRWVKCVVDCSDGAVTWQHQELIQVALAVLETLERMEAGAEHAKLLTGLEGDLRGRAGASMVSDLIEWLSGETNQLDVASLLYKAIPGGHSGEQPSGLLARLMALLIDPSAPTIPKLQHVTDATEQLTRAGMDLLKSGLSVFGFGSAAPAHAPATSATAHCQLHDTIVIFVVGGITLHEVVHSTIAQVVKTRPDLRVLVGSTTVTSPGKLQQHVVWNHIGQQTTTT
ncbi:hypothetical protein DYB28_000948 [Aphanomyces astaci]|uniref:Sec1 family domain-containing protein 2 n=2 Tax=Aphanomyces astaci TaxID=112090 RepID=A0A9X8DSK8_APHAT|nr:hypothetical protein DYB28_000948 [Aphanomyces astaci]